MLRDTLLGATAAALRGPLFCNSLSKIGDAVYEALRERARSEELNFGNDNSATPYRMLIDLLADIAREDGNAISTQLAAEAASSLYIELENDCGSVTIVRIQDRLSEKFGEKIIRHLLLARARGGLVRKHNRNAEEQMAWEEQLFGQLSKPLRDMIGKMFRTDRKITVRAPRRATPQRKMTIEELHEGIAVLKK